MYFLDCTSGEDLSGEIMAALYTCLAFRTFGAAHEKNQSMPNYIAYLALAYEYGFGDCKKIMRR